MTINLSDLRAAVVAAIDAMPVTISAPEELDTFGHDDQFDIHFTISNTAAGAVRVVNTYYHVIAGGTAQLQPPQGVPMIARATSDRSSPALDRNRFYDEMFIFPTPDTLDVDDSASVYMKGKATEPGRVTITVHPHGAADLTYLFPTESGTNVVRTVDIV